MGDTSRETEGPIAFARRVLITTLVVASVALLLYFTWYSADLLLLVFASVLISILLRGFSRALCRKTGLGRGASLAIVMLAVIGFLAVVAWLFTGRIGSQLQDLHRKLPEAIENVSQSLEHYEWARNAINSLPSMADWLSSRSSTIVSRLTGLASTTLSGVLNMFFAAVIGFYLAAQPELYLKGITHLVPRTLRARAGEILSTLDEVLWQLLVGRACLMLLNGVLTTIGLLLLGVPLALSLGFVAGLLSFIPYFGPWVATAPAVLIAFLQSPQQALNVALLYLVLQSIDGYVFTPLADRRSVELPPVLTISAQMLLGLGFGFLGILLAPPITATVMILVKMLYVEDILGDRVRITGGEPEQAKPAG